jgi:hypothetical protein
MNMNDIKPTRRTLGQSAIIRTRIGMGFKTAGRTVSAAEASRKTAAFFRAADRRQG